MHLLRNCVNRFKTARDNQSGTRESRSPRKRDPRSWRAGRAVWPPSGTRTRREAPRLPAGRPTILVDVEPRDSRGSRDRAHAVGPCSRKLHATAVRDELTPRRGAAWCGDPPGGPGTGRSRGRTCVAYAYLIAEGFHLAFCQLFAVV